MNISRFKNKLTSPRMGAVVFLVAGVVALWTCAMVEFTQENKRETYAVNIRPGIVNYGTHSSATIPLVSAPQHSSVAPLISGNTVRSYAYSGHASMPSNVSSGRIRTTSVGKANTSSVAAGTNGGSASSGVSSGATPRRASNALGASYSAGVVPMPMMAMVSRSYASEVSAMGASSTADESLSGKTSLGGKKDGGVVSSTPGTPDNPGDLPPIPVGHTPWLLMLLFAAGYTLFLTKKSHQA